MLFRSQADAGPSYNAVFISDDLTKIKPIEVGCWMHARRGFYQVARNTGKTGLAYDAVQTIRVLYAVEKLALEKRLNYQQLYELRQEKAVPVLNNFKDWLDEKSTLVLPNSALGIAMQYTLNQWNAFEPIVDINYLFKLSNDDYYIAPFYDYKKIIFNEKNHKNIIIKNETYIDIDVDELIKYKYIFLK